jgi:hypothetical protein
LSEQADLRSGDTMFRRSPRRTLEAIVTQANALIVALAWSDLKRSVAIKNHPTRAPRHRAR